MILFFQSNAEIDEYRGLIVGLLSSTFVSSMKLFSSLLPAFNAKITVLVQFSEFSVIKKLNPPEAWIETTKKFAILAIKTAGNNSSDAA